MPQQPFDTEERVLGGSDEAIGGTESSETLVGYLP